MTDGCENNAQFKCHFCKKIICLHHHSRMHYFGTTIETCPGCVIKVRRHRFFFVLCLFIGIAASVALSLYLARDSI